MTPQPDPMQVVEQEIFSQAVLVDEQLAQIDPSVPAITHEQKAVLAYEIWEANGAIQDDPLTISNWLESETLLLSQSTKPPPAG